MNKSGSTATLLPPPAPVATYLFIYSVPLSSDQNYLASLESHLSFLREMQMLPYKRIGNKMSRKQKEPIQQRTQF